MKHLYFCSCDVNGGIYHYTLSNGKFTFCDKTDPEYATKVTASIAVGFYGEPEDCAPMVALLCSDEGRYITGQSIFVDGGKSVQ